MMQIKVGSLNAWQKVVLETYMDGEFAHVADMGTSLWYIERNIGDRLLSLMLNEVGDDGDARPTKDLALHRLRVLVEDLSAVIAAIEKAGP